MTSIIANLLIILRRLLDPPLGAGILQTLLDLLAGLAGAQHREIGRLRVLVHARKKTRL